MKTQKLKGLEIIPPKEESGKFETPINMPKGHNTCCAVGVRNTGKSVAIVNIIEKMGYDYVILVSPTMSSNKEIMSRLNVEHIFEDPDDLTIIDKIKDIVKKEAEELERYHEELKNYNKLMKDLKEGKFMSDDILLQYFGEDSFVKPEHRWNGRKPFIACFFDDLLGSGIFSKPRKLNALTTYHRHLGQLKEGGSIGISLYFAIQKFKCVCGGLNPTIRNNLTNLLIFKTKNERELEDISESVSGECGVETFNKVYNYAIGDGQNYEFLFIDLFKKKEHPSMFRKYLNEFIIPEELNKN